MHNEGNYKQGEKTAFRMGEAAYQAPPSMGFSRQEYWSGLPLPSPNSKQSNRQRINLKNTEAAPAAQFQKNKQPNQKMGRRPKQTFLQKRHRDGQKAFEKTLNIVNY